ncbi:hypothetical protein LTR67_005968 [Exophiala xenobiotica]
MEEKAGLSTTPSPRAPRTPITESTFQPPLRWSDTITTQQSRTQGLSRVSTRHRQPWRHSVSKSVTDPLSQTLREYKPFRQRQRLLIKAMFHWVATSLLCGLLAMCLGVFGGMLKMTVSEIKLFNALIVLFSLFLGNNLSGTLREFALMFRWRLLASKYRSLGEFDLLLSCESLRKVLRLFWATRTRGRLWFRFNRTQCLCALWLFINMCLQVLVALLGVTYNLETAKHPGVQFGLLSVANLTEINDIWSADNPDLMSQLGSANSYGIQGQDYNFITGPVPGQTGPWAFGTPSTPTVYGNGPDWTSMTYAFQDANPRNTAITLISHRNITTEATCKAHRVTDGGDGIASYVTYIDDLGSPVTLEIPFTDPGAMVYIGVLNSTCGPRCTQLMALQTSNGETIPTPSFYSCNNTLSAVEGVESYLFPGLPQNEATFQLADKEARIIAGAIGWSVPTSVNASAYQYARYTPSSYWSPNHPTSAYQVGQRVMEFAAQAVAALDYNGPQRNVTGWYPVLAQSVTVEWPWAGAILGLVPVVQLIASVCVILWSNTAIIRDESHLSTARLLRPLVQKLGNKGCLLSGEEIAETFPDVRVKYGWREPDNLVFRNEIDSRTVRHVDILEEQEGLGKQGIMPAGFYDGLPSDEDDDVLDERTRLLRRRRRRKRRRSI